MTVTTREQDAAAEELALTGRSVRVSPLRLGGSVLLTAEGPGGGRTLRAVDENGDPACEACGGTSGVCSRGAYGDRCEFCWDLILAQS